jgi:hypothetical protein
MILPAIVAILLTAAVAAFASSTRARVVAVTATTLTLALSLWALFSLADAGGFFSRQLGGYRVASSTFGPFALTQISALFVGIVHATTWLQAMVSPVRSRLLAAQLMVLAAMTLAFSSTELVTSVACVLGASVLTGLRDLRQDGRPASVFAAHRIADALLATGCVCALSAGASTQDALSFVDATAQTFTATQANWLHAAAVSVLASVAVRMGTLPVAPRDDGAAVDVEQMALGLWLMWRLQPLWAHTPVRDVVPVASLVAVVAVLFLSVFACFVSAQRAADRLTLAASATLAALPALFFDPVDAVLGFFVVLVAAATKNGATRGPARAAATAALVLFPGAGIVVAERALSRMSAAFDGSAATLLLGAVAFFVLAFAHARALFGTVGTVGTVGVAAEHSTTFGSISVRMALLLGVVGVLSTVTALPTGWFDSFGYEADVNSPLADLLSAGRLTPFVLPRAAPHAGVVLAAESFLAIFCAWFLFHSSGTGTSRSARWAEAIQQRFPFLSPLFTRAQKGPRTLLSEQLEEGTQTLSRLIASRFLPETTETVVVRVPRLLGRTGALLLSLLHNGSPQRAVSVTLWFAAGCAWWWTR